MVLELGGTEQELPVVAEQHYAQISLKPEQGHHFLVVAELQPDEIQKDLELGGLQPAVVVVQLVVGVAGSVEDCPGRFVGYKASN